MSTPGAPTPSTAPDVGTDITYFGCWGCPGAHRTSLGLQAKGLKHHWCEINTQAPKPTWFTDLVPDAKVPTIAYREGSQLRIVNDNRILLEFLDDFSPANPLLPKAPHARAAARLVLLRFDTKFIPAFYGILKSYSAEEAHTHAKALEEELAWLDTAVSDPELVSTDRLSFVDCTILPWFVRAGILLHYRGYDMLKKLPPNLASWYARLMKDPLVEGTFIAPEGKEYFSGLVTHYTNYGREVAVYF